VAGGLVAAGLCWLLDALLLHARANVEPPITGVYLYPSLLAILAAMLALATDVESIDEPGVDIDGARACATCATLLAFLLFFGALAHGAALVTASYARADTAFSYIAPARLNVSSSGGDDESVHVSVSIAVTGQALSVFVATILVIGARVARADRQRVNTR